MRLENFKQQDYYLIDEIQRLLGRAVPPFRLEFPSEEHSHTQMKQTQPAIAFSNKKISIKAPLCANYRAEQTQGVLSRVPGTVYGLFGASFSIPSSGRGP